MGSGELPPPNYIGLGLIGPYDVGLGLLDGLTAPAAGCPFACGTLPMGPGPRGRAQGGLAPSQNTGYSIYSKPILFYFSEALRWMRDAGTAWGWWLSAAHAPGDDVLGILE